MNTIAVIDYGMGNLHSVAKAIEHAPTSCKIIVTHDKSAILNADRVVLPGVGAMRDCMGEIKRLELDDVIKDVARNKPFLGVCVGMQALLDHSSENEGVQCLGLISGDVKYFGDEPKDNNNEKLKVPHMGWNKVDQKLAHPLWKGIPSGSRFYFVHSYYACDVNEEYISGTTEYGVTFSSAIARDNIFAAQFHPEKSQHSGLQLYENFINWDGNNQGQ